MGDDTGESGYLPPPERSTAPAASKVRLNLALEPANVPEFEPCVASAPEEKSTSLFLL